MVREGFLTGSTSTLGLCELDSWGYSVADSNRLGTGDMPDRVGEKPLS
jgi:hypothetical protein